MSVSVSFDDPFFDPRATFPCIAAFRPMRTVSAEFSPHVPHARLSMRLSVRSPLRCLHTMPGGARPHEGFQDEPVDRPLFPADMGAAIPVLGDRGLELPPW